MQHQADCAGCGKCVIDLMRFGSIRWSGLFDIANCEYRKYMMYDSVISAATHYAISDFVFVSFRQCFHHTSYNVYDMWQPPLKHQHIHSIIYILCVLVLVINL